MIVHILEWTAWVVSAVLAVWMVQDAVRTGRKNSEEYLITSIEGADELIAPPGLEDVK